MATRIETQESAEEVRNLLLEYKARTGESWTALARQVGIPAGTLSTFGGGTYGGDVLRVAADVRRYLDGSAELARMNRGEVRDPGFVATPTAQRVLSLLRWAHTGKLVAIACTPGVGKTTAAEEYRTQAANVFLATMGPSTSGVQPMQTEVLRAMGDSEAKGSPAMLTQRVLQRVRNARALIIIDEAQELSIKAINEIRGWNDRAGVGIALLGAPALIGQMTGLRSRELAQVNSRISMRHVQHGPDGQDPDLIARAWGLTAAEQLAFLRKIAAKPGALRIMVHVIELASVLAADAARPLALADLQDAWTQLRSDVTVPA